jgi:MtN3 and saliva related transmembrane protein
MFFLDILGFTAGFCSMIIFVPQVYKTWKNKSAKDISIQMFIICFLSNILWIIYGLFLKEPAIYITNIVMLSLVLTQIILKIKYDIANKNY